jgi:hypothetical protein
MEDKIKMDLKETGWVLNTGTGGKDHGNVLQVS